MSKKRPNLGTIDNLLVGEEPQGVVEEQAAPAKRKKGRPKEEEYEARTFRVKKELVQKLRIIALKEGCLQKDILDFALESTIARYEKKNGTIDVSDNIGQKNIKDIF